MRTRRVYLVGSAGAGQGVADAATFTLNLTGVGKIRWMRIHFEDTNGGTSNTVGNLHSMVSKIQVVDGSRVLHSLSMQEEIALNAYRYGAMPQAFLTQDASAVLTEDCYIDFRLHNRDRSRWLDTNNYRSPMLLITWAMTISATAGFTTADATLTVEAEIIDDGAPTYAGFLMQKEISSAAALASGISNVLCQLDYPYIGLAVLIPYAATDPTTIITQIGLVINAGAIAPFLLETTDVHRGLVRKYPPFRQVMNPIHGGTANTLKFDLYKDTEGSVGAAGATALAVLSTLAANQAVLAKTTAETGQQNVRLSGYLPMGCFWLPFGSGFDMEDALDPTQFQSMQVNLTNAAATGTVTVVTEQLCPQ